jgi:hypothetical protein
LYEFCVVNRCNTCLLHSIFCVGCEVCLVSSRFQITATYILKVHIYNLVY